MRRARRILRAMLAGWLGAGLLASPARAARLTPETSAAFGRYLRASEARMDAGLRQGIFFAVDKLPPDRREEAYAQLRQGRLYLVETRTRENGRAIPIPGGLVHDWAGVVFLPGASLSQTAAVLENYEEARKIYAPDVRRSELRERRGNESKFSLQLFYRSLVTVAMDADFDSVYMPLGGSRFQILSRSTRVAEVAEVGKPGERELPVGDGHGYLWGLNTYWRAEQRDGGVYLQMEFIALTRRVPFLLAWLVNPLLESIPRKILSDLLNATRQAVGKAAPAGTFPGTGARPPAYPAGRGRGTVANSIAHGILRRRTGRARPLPAPAIAQKLWIPGTSGISASSPTLTTANPRWRTACWS